MKIETKNFKLRNASEGAYSVSIPNSYDGLNDWITIDFGEVKRDQPVNAVFIVESDVSKVSSVSGSCGCTNLSDYENLPSKDSKNTQKLIIDYKSSRIGKVDFGNITKEVVYRMDNGNKIKFKLKIKEG